MDKELIITGIKYLSDNIRFKDQPDFNGKYGSQCPAKQYAESQLRVIRRVIDFIRESDNKSMEFHNIVLNELVSQIDQETFELFYRIWSREERSKNPIEVSDSFRKVNGKWVKES